MASALGFSSSPKSPWSRRSAATSDPGSPLSGTRRTDGPRGSADPTHDGRDGLPPVRDFSPLRRHRQRAEASRGHGRIRAPPRLEFRLQAPGPHTMRGRVDAGSRTRHAPASRAVCDATHAECNSAPHPPTCPPLPITPTGAGCSKEGDEKALGRQPGRGRGIRGERRQVAGPSPDRGSASRKSPSSNSPRAAIGSPVV